MCSVEVFVHAFVHAQATSVTALECITSNLNTIWKLLSLEWVEWKPILWQWHISCLIVAETSLCCVGRGADMEVRREVRGLLSKLSCYSAGFKRSRERRGGGFPPGPWWPELWLTNEISKVSNPPLPSPPTHHQDNKSSCQNLLSLLYCMQEHPHT